MVRLSERLFLFFLFLLPFQTEFLLREPMIGKEKWQYGTIGMYLSSLMLVFAIISAAIESGERFRRIRIVERMRFIRRKRSGDVFLFVFILWAGLSIVLEQDRALAAYGFLTMLLAVGAFIMVQVMVRRGKGDRIVTVLIVSAMIQALIGIWQFLSQETFTSTLLGTSAHPIWQAGTSVLKNGTGRFLRAYGTFPHPNVYGLFLAVSLLLVIMRIIDMCGKPIAANAWKRTAHIAAIPILSFGLIVSYSRLAWAGCTFGILAFGIHLFRNSFRCHPGLDWKSIDSGPRTGMTRRYVFAICATVIVSVSVFAGMMHETIFPRFDGAVIFQEGSVTDRMTTYRDAIRVIRDSPFSGAGMWNSTAELIRLDPGRPVWDIQPAHDVPLLILTELGILGLLLAVPFVVLIISDSIKKKNTATIAMFLVLLPSLLLDHFLWTSSFGLLFLFVLFGMSAESESDE